MTDTDRELLIRALGDELDEASRRKLEQRLGEDAELRREWESLQRVEGLLAESNPQGFQPFFAARVMQRLEARQSEGVADSLAEALAWVFRPLVPVVVVACLALAVSNWSAREMVGQEASFVEATLSMLPPSVDSAEILSL